MADSMVSALTAASAALGTNELAIADGTTTSKKLTVAQIQTLVSAATLGLPLALTGATAATRYVGAVALGPPTSGTFAGGDFVIDQTGLVWVCSSAGTPGTWRCPTHDPNARGGGEETLPRLLCPTNAVSSASGALCLTYFTAKCAVVCTKIESYVTGTAAAATPSLCRVGLYSVASNGNLSLVASAANATSLWSATWTPYVSSLSASYTLIGGQRYALGYLIVTAGATPTFYGSLTTPWDWAPVVWGAVGSQTDLPSTITAGSVGWVSGPNPTWMAIYP
jgi:hypothetical protein